MSRGDGHTAFEGSRREDDPTRRLINQKVSQQYSKSTAQKIADVDQKSAATRGIRNDAIRANLQAYSDEEDSYDENNIPDPTTVGRSMMKSQNLSVESVFGAPKADPEVEEEKRMKEF